MFLHLHYCITRFLLLPRFGIHLLIFHSNCCVCYTISMSVFPIIRMSVQVHYRKNENLALLNTVNNALRETVYKTAPDIFFYDRPRSWVIDNVLDGGKHLD